MQVKWAIHVVKYLANISISNGDYSFAIVQIFVASDGYIGTNVKRVFTILNLILRIAFTSANSAKVS